MMLGREFSRESGASLIEYSLLIAVVAFIAIGALGSFGIKNSNKFVMTAGSLDGSTNVFVNGGGSSTLMNENDSVIDPDDQPAQGREGGEGQNIP